VQIIFQYDDVTPCILLSATKQNINSKIYPSLDMQRKRTKKKKPYFL
jgi:hypothetical protein